MNSDELCFLPLHELAGQLRTAKISSTEVTRAILDRIRNKARLHAYITVMEESALRAAAVADDDLRAGRYRGPLHGVPLGVKDLCWTKGALTTCASGVLRDWRPEATATAVERLEAAGAVIAGGAAGRPSVGGGAGAAIGGAGALVGCPPPMLICTTGAWPVADGAAGGVASPPI